MTMRKQTISRILSSRVMKNRAAAELVVNIVKRGQEKNRPRDWFIQEISVLVVAKFAARLLAAFEEGRLTDQERQQMGYLRKENPPEKSEAAQKSAPKPSKISDADIRKAAARLLRKVPMLERCVGEMPFKPVRRPPYMPGTSLARAALRYPPGAL